MAYDNLDAWSKRRAEIEEEERQQKLEQQLKQKQMTKNLRQPKSK